MLPHALTKFEMQRYRNKHKFNSVYSRNNLPKIKDGTYVINLGECKSTGSRWIVLYVNGDKGTNITMLDILLRLELNTFQRKLRDS